MGFKLVDNYVLPSAASTVTIGGGSSGSSTYNYAIPTSTNNPHFVVIQNVGPSNDDVSLYCRVTKSGSADTSSNYDTTHKNMYDQTYNVSNTFNASENMMNMGNCGTGNSETHNAYFWLYNFGSSTLSSVMSRTHMNVSSGQRLYGQIGGTSQSVASATDGLVFYFASGNIAKGSFTMYEVT